MTEQPLVYIILLNYRGVDHTLGCLYSLKKLDYLNYRIIIVDNDSQDGSLERLQDRVHAQPWQFHLIASTSNLGYSGGNNLGIRHALQEIKEQGKKLENAYIWLLNNDTTVDPGALDALVEEAQKTGGLVGSRLLNEDGSYQQVGSRFNRWTGGVSGYTPDKVTDGMPVESLTGASMLIPALALEKAGLLDESYFLYFEDGEYSLRCKKLGFPLTVALSSRVFHKEGATTGKRSLQTQYYYHRNRIRLLLAYTNPLQQLSIKAYSTFRMLRAVVKSLSSSDPARRKTAKVQWLALRDALQGVSGKCLYDLEKL